jgi:hypothetical protein
VNLHHQSDPDRKGQRLGPQFLSGRRRHDDLRRANRC